jgi:hydroxymethylbilane synthase
MMVISNEIRLGTRGSLLARTQSSWVADRIETDRTIALSIIKTEGDDLSISLTKPSDPGVFVTALRNALLSGEVDFIVHSYKDLPSTPHPEIEIAAVPLREDHRDVLITNNNAQFHDLMPGMVVGSSSPRRVSAIKHLNPKLIAMPIRGNIDSRIRKIREGEYDAAILAAAGLSRIGLKHEISQYFDLEMILPAPAQGALAVECRKNDTKIFELLQSIDDSHTRITTTAERALLRGLNAGCDLAIGAYATLVHELITLTCEIADPQTGQQERIVVTGPYNQAEELGLQAAHTFANSDFGRKVLDRDN